MGLATQKCVQVWDITAKYMGGTANFDRLGVAAFNNFSSVQVCRSKVGKKGEG